MAAKNKDQRKRTTNEKILLNEALIALVKDRPTLWDSRHPDHRKSIILEENWREISAAMGFQPGMWNSVFDRWKNLRDTFVRKQKMVYDCRESNEPVNIKWAHYKQMQFLADTVIHRKRVDVIDPLIGTPDTFITLNQSGHTWVFEKEESPESDILSYSNLSANDTHNSEEEVEIIENSNDSKRKCPTDNNSATKKKRVSLETLNRQGESTDDNSTSDSNNGVVSTQVVELSNGSCLSANELFFQSVLSDFEKIPDNMKDKAKINILYLISQYKCGLAPKEVLL